MASSSSTKRAAKMAQRGKGRKVRFQNGTTFPAIIALILILGFGLIVYSRQSIAPPDATPPQPGAEWEVAYGFNLCGTWYQFAESASIEGTPAFERYEKYGFDSQGDGIAYLSVTEENKSEVAGKRAVLQKFFDVYGATVDDDKITFSPDYLPTAVDGDGVADAEYSEADTKCGDKRAEMAVRVWNTPTAPKSQRYIAKVGQIRITQPAMVFAIYFDDPDAEQTQPPSVAALQALIAESTPTPVTSVPTDSLPDVLAPVSGDDSGTADTGQSTVDSSTSSSSTN